ncbi:acyl-CoA thioesterase [Neobacillus dielmonensis]|uniref:acyl-CoA thioesterase n=1 Tax=Neobacillus dielmonensis TaxID=1347369 RepID=UPI0005AB7C73|nr:thioesterase family protein [Neobacillus dielmonensis]
MDGYRFFHKLKVRYSEIDGQKIVFNAHYLTYIDVAVTEYFHEGLNLNFSETDFDFVLAKSTLEYKQPARLNDWLTIWCKMSKIGNTSMTMNCLITREEEVEPILLAEIIYVSFDPVMKNSRPVPDFVRSKIEAFESGQKL